MLPPGGADIHWSRLVDLPLAGLILLFQPFRPMFRAEQVAVTIAPLLPRGVFVASPAFIRRSLFAPNAWAIAPALSLRSGERRGGKEGVRRCRFRCSPLNKKKNKKN